MSVVPFPVPALDAADRILERLDLTCITEEQFIELMREGGFRGTSTGSCLSVREQLAYLASSLGEAETLQRILELGGEEVTDGDADPASIEFQVSLAASLARQGDGSALPAAVLDIAYGELCDLCGDLDVRLHPWVTRDGKLLIQWRRQGSDRLAVFAADGNGVSMTLAHGSYEVDLPYDREELLLFLRA